MLIQKNSLLNAIDSPFWCWWWSKVRSNFLPLLGAYLQISYRGTKHASASWRVHGKFVHPFFCLRTVLFLFFAVFLQNFSNFAHPFFYNEGVCARSSSPLRFRRGCRGMGQVKTDLNKDGFIDKEKKFFLVPNLIYSSATIFSSAKFNLF